MKTSHLTVVLTLTCLLGLGMSARAEDGSSVVVSVPFEFVAGAKTMPAGKYNVGPIFLPAVDRGLVIRDHDTGVVLLPMTFDRVPAERTQLSFEHVGGKYFLSKVETPRGVYEIGVSRAISKLDQIKNNLTLSSSGGN
jgi:hypothetical protein